MGQIDILMVFPNNRTRAYGSLAETISAIAPPVQDGLTAAYLRGKGIKVHLIDADADGLMPDQVAAEALRLEPLLVHVGTDQVNSGDVTKVQAAGETARAIKNLCPDIPVVMSGNVPSALPEKILMEEGADFVCQGEPYVPIENLVRMLRDKGRNYRLASGELAGIWARYGDEVVSSSHSPRFGEIDELPVTAWDLMPPANYRAHHWHCFDRLGSRSPYAAIFTNMGCPYSCTFCCVNVMAGGQNLRVHSTDYVMRELELLVDKYSVRNIRILDNVFTARLDVVEELCTRIAGKWKDLNLWAYARVETIRDRNILKVMKKAGVNWLAYGFEAADKRVKQAMNKPTDNQMTERVIEWTRSAGINIGANFIFGLPEDDIESMRATLSMATTHNFEWVNFYCAMAYPGTSLHEQARRQGVPLPSTWSGYGQYSPDSMPLPTKYLSSKEVLAFRDRAFKEYYNSSQYQRMIETKFGSDALAFLRQILSQDVKRSV